MMGSHKKWKPRQQRLYVPFTPASISYEMPFQHLLQNSTYKVLPIQ